MISKFYRLAGCVAVALIFSSDLFGQVAAWNLTSTTTTATTVASNMTASAISLSSGTIAYQASPSNINTGTWSTSASFSAAGKYWQFSITPNATYSISVSALSFDAGRTAAGPALVTVQYSLNGFGTAGTTILSGGANDNTSTLTTISANTGLPIAATNSTITFRIWGYNASSTGNFRLNNVSISGTVIPPTPTTTSISPTSATAGGSGFTLTVNGTNFISGTSTVQWNGSPRTTTYVSATQLTAAITAADILTAGPATVTVLNTGNPTASNGQTFTINAGGGPSLAIAGSPITGMATVAGNAQSPASTYTLSGTSLDGSVINIAAPTNFEISKDGSNFFNSLTLTQGTDATYVSATTLNNTTISVRIKSTAPVGGVSGNVTNTGGGQVASSDVSVSGTVTASNTSNIIALGAPTFTPPGNVAYGSNISGSIANDGSNSVEVARFRLQDGGGSNDADNLADTITAITFSLSNFANIQRVALFDGLTELQEVGGAATVTFNAAALKTNLIAADNGSKDFSLRVTYNTTVTDNQQYQFAITSATATTQGSQFAAANAGGASSSITGDDNRIEVTATALIFTTQPSPTTINVSTNFSTAAVVAARDANNNTDLDKTGSVTVANTQGYTMSNAPTAFTAPGIITFPVNFQFTSAGVPTTNITVDDADVTTTNASSNAITVVDPYININAVNVDFDQNFNSIAGSTANGTGGSVLPTGWLFNETGANADATYTVGTGSSATGDTYLFGVTGNADRTFGGLRSGNVVPTIGAQYRNTTGVTITSLKITYTGKTWRVGTTGRSDILDFEYSTNATSLTSGSWTGVSALDYANVASGSTGSGSILHSSNISFTITGLSIANNATFMVRWNDIDATGGDDGMGIDDYSIRANPVASSALSNIIAASFTAPNGFDYKNYTASTANSLEVGKFTIQDGGGSADGDVLGTTLAAITFSLSNSSNIQRVALYDGSTELEAVAGGATVTFSAAALASNLIAGDDGAKDFSLRVTFNNTVTDNQNYQFVVTSATANPATSTFALPDAGGASTSVAGNDNRITVTADRIKFTTQPSGTQVNTNIAPIVIAAVDANGSVDADKTNTVTLSTNGTGMTATGNPYTLVNGQKTITGAIQFNAAQSGIKLAATTTGLTINQDSSNAFSITTFVFLTGDYRPAFNGADFSMNNSWEQFDGTNWNAVAPSPQSLVTKPRITIHRPGITGGGSSSNKYNDIIVLTGGELYLVDNDAPPVASEFLNANKKLEVLNGGKLYIQGDIDLASTDSLIVRSGGIMYLDQNSLTNDHPMWDGRENFESGSTVYLYDWDFGASATVSSIVNVGLSISDNADGYKFGNFYYDATPSTTHTLVGGAVTVNFCHDDLTVVNNSANNLGITSNNGGPVITIGGNIIHQAGPFSLSAGFSSGTATQTVNINGSVTSTGASALRVWYNGGSATPGTNALNVNLKGSLTATGASFSSDNALANLNLTGTTAQLINVSPNADRIRINVKNNAIARLSANNLKLNTGGEFTVETGGTLDFNWDALNNPLLITQPASPSGTNKFTSQQGSRLYITSGGGLSTSGSTGNVQVATGATNRSINQTAYFYYVGKTAQVTGDGLTAGSVGRVVTVNLLSNATTLTLTNNIGISAGTTIEPAPGGRLQIDKGTVVGTAGGDFTGGGRLVMTDGIYQMGETGVTLPQLANYANYSLTGGVVELNGAGAQTLSDGPASYYNVKISGSNSGNEKTVGGVIVISNNLEITGTPIFNTANNRIWGTAGLTMNGGRWRNSKTTNAQPELSGTATPYNITGGTLEYYGTTTSNQQTISGGETYFNIDINAGGPNVTDGNVNTNAGFVVNGAFTVFGPAFLKLNPTDAVTGGGTFEVKADAGLLYGSSNGITGSGATGNIRLTGTRTYATGASYGFIGTGNMVTGNGLPATVKNLYLNKGNAANTVTLTNGVSLTGDLGLASGLLVLGTNDITLPAASAVTGTPSSTAMVVTNGAGQFVKGFNAGAASFVYPIGDNTGTIEYSPFSLSLSANTAPGNVGVIVTDAIPTNNNSSTNYASRFWTLSNTLTNYTYTGSFTYTAADKVGSETLYKASRRTGATWNAIAGSSATGNVVSITTPQTQATSPLTGDYNARLEVASGTYTWLGNTAEWELNTNWSTNTVPNSCADNVYIPVTSNAPIVTDPAQVGNVQIDNNIRLELNAPLNVCGTWTGGTSTTLAPVIAGTDAVVLGGSSLQSIAGKTRFTKLHLNNSAGAQMAAPATADILEALELEAGTFTSNGNLKFVSTSSTQVAVIDNFSPGYTGTLSGNIVAQRGYDAPTTANSFKQHFMGSPVNSPAVSQFGASGTPGFIQPMAQCYVDQQAPGSPFGNFFEYDESNGTGCGMKSWKAVTTGNAQNGKGYSVAKNGAGTLTLTGEANLNATYTVSGLNNSNYSNKATYRNTAISNDTVTISSGWHLVSNPYMAYLNLTTHVTDSAFGSQAQVWETTGPFEGSYQPRIAGSGSALIAPFQAFMVRKLSTVSPAATYTIFASDRTLSTTTFYRQANDNELKIFVENTATGLLDVTSVAFNTDATAQFDAVYDANKLGGSQGRHTLFTTDGNGTELAINTNNSVLTTPTVAMGMKPGAGGNFKFKVEGINSFDPTTYIYLEDKVTGQWVDLRQNPDYAFSMNRGEYANRFVLHFTPPAVLTADAASCNAAGVINIVQPGTANWQYAISAAQNVIISSGTLNQNSPVTVSAAAGVYTLQLTDNNGYVVVKNIQVTGATPVNADFTATAFTVEAGESVTLSNSYTAAVSVEWTMGDGTFINNVTNPTYTFNQPGNYTVVLTVTNADGCSASIAKTITVTAATISGLNNIAGNNGIRVWSNKNKVNVDFSKAKNVMATIAIYDLLGRQMSNEKFNAATIYSKEFNQLEAVYVMIRIENDGVITTKKLLISNK